MVDGVSRTLLFILSFSVLPVVLEDKVDKLLAGMAAIRNAAMGWLANLLADSVGH